MSAKRMLELQIDKAVAYTIHKGRMPNDVHELREWLREFAEFERRYAESAVEAYKEHMRLCNRPIIIKAKDCEL